MPIITPEALRRAISPASNGIGIDAIAVQLGGKCSRRTLQRKLDELAKAGQIERIGKARATKYRPLKVPHVELPEDDGVRSRSRFLKPLEVELAPSVVREGPPVDEGGASLLELRDYFREHFSLRKPTGYRREFLDSYQPNETRYLPEKLCEYLRTRGQSPEMADMPPGTYARQLLGRLIIDLSWNSSRLEGSTFSLLETDALLQLGRSDDPARQREALMILNHKTAIEFLTDAPGELGFNRHTFLNLHAILTEGLLEHDEAEGALRTRQVGISGSVFHPTNNPALIEECFGLILQKAGAIRDPLECCFFLMVHMPYLQPFEDGNKRTSRLAANIPLIQANMAPLSFTGVPVREYTTGILGVYELNRVELLREVFVHAYLESASRYVLIRDDLGMPDPISTGYRAEIKDLAREVVVKLMDKLAAADHVRRWAAKNVTASDRDRFVEVMERRLMRLGPGNYVRERLRPSEFEAWWPLWNGTMAKKVK